MVRPIELTFYEGYTNCHMHLGSLDRRLFDDNVSLDLQTKIKWMHDIACGVYHLHANNIIHRDLAARNILLSNNTPKISVSVKNI